MKQHSIIFVFLTCLLAAAPAMAASPREAFTAFNNCLKKGNAENCRDHVTASSASLYDRFASYGLLRCLPKDVAYVSETTEGKQVTIRASTQQGDQLRYMRLIFVEEEGAWKLDAPASLQRAMGKNWQQQVNLTEQIYLMLQKQMGDQSCETIKSLWAKNTKNAN